MKLTQEQFIDNFVVTFLATWCANEYNDSCMNGQQERLNRPPVEDARFLAQKAWEHYQEIFT